MTGGGLEVELWCRGAFWDRMIGCRLDTACKQPNGLRPDQSAYLVSLQIYFEGKDRVIRVRKVRGKSQSLDKAGQPVLSAEARQVLAALGVYQTIDCQLEIGGYH
uniref:Arm-DNA-bind_2 domain-containing protein n=1 Tax=Macrostomum lignano TaxID=282301 RepID=A0A1I8JP42_9PLAT